MAGRRGRNRGYTSVFKELRERKEAEDERVTQRSSHTSEQDNQSKSEADKQFDSVLSKVTPCDIYAEYLHFKNIIPTLLESEEQKILETVEKHLNIVEVRKSIASGNESMNLKSSSIDKTFPILDALSVKLGFNLRYLIAPPTTTCLLCHNTLTRHNNRTPVALHTLNGPRIGSKYSYQCRNCVGIYNFRQQLETNNRIYYHPDMFGNPQAGSRGVYPSLFKLNSFL